MCLSVCSLTGSLNRVMRELILGGDSVDVVRKKVSVVQYKPAPQPAVAPPPPVSLSFPCPVLLTVDVVSATESRWFAILSNSRAEAKPSPTAPTMGIKAAKGGCFGSDRMPQDLQAHSVSSLDTERLKMVFSLENSQDWV